ncbi:MAG: peptidase, partial [Halobacteriaceae archaeon]
MSRSPSLPDRPNLDLDPESSPEERLAALEAHFADVQRVNEQLNQQLEEVRSRREELENEADRLQRENETLKTASLYVATVEDFTDDGVVVKQHGNNQEVLTEVSARLRDQLEPGDRVAINDSFAIQEVLDTETDARAQAMEVEESPAVEFEDIGGLADQLQEVRETVEEPLEQPERFAEVGIEPPSGVLLHGPPGTGKTMM